MRKLISISLSLIFLLGNLSVTYGTHFCGGHSVISEVMLGEKHLDCGMAMMEMMEMPERSKNDSNVAAPECCSNEYISPETDTALQQDFSQKLTPTLVLIVPNLKLYEVHLNQKTNRSPYFDPSPPLPDRDFNSLYQVFII